MKLNKLLYYSLIFIITLLISVNVYAKDGMVTGTDVRIRSGAGTSYDSLGNVDAPSIYTLLDENKISPTDGTSYNCDSWYKISYNSQTGYICSEFFSIIPTSSTSGGSGNFESDLANFPSSYRNAITELHKLYPNATFTVLNTGLDWNDVVNAENYIAAGSSKHTARSLIQTSYDGYKSTNSILYNWSTNVWNTNISGGGSSWYAAHEDVIAYYLDPRNFLTYNSSFMFLNHGYSTNITYTENAINSILSGSFMANSMTNDEVHTFAQAFLDAGESSGISPYYLAARVIQEIGRSSSRSSYVDGKYNGYYNYYNIDATGSNNLTGALTRAKNEGWDNDYKAIIGGAKFISDGYVSTGQTTLYLEKWDVVNGGNGFYSHQYMQNVQAPVSEANILYNAYANSGLLSTSMEFLIPVYNNMNSTSLPNKGNPNNYLKDVTINGYTINGFNMNTLEYTYNVSSAVTSVEVGASKIASASSVSGTGTIKLSGDSTKHVITVTAENGSKKTYTINFTRDDSKPISVSDIVSSRGFVSDGTYISGIAVGSSADSLINELKKASSSISVTVTTSDGKAKSGEVATGDKITIISGNETKTYSVVIYGDINGDGKIDKLDYLAILRHYYGYRTYSDAYVIAADVNKDGNVDKLDYLAVLRDFYGYAKIKQ